METEKYLTNSDAFNFKEYREKKAEETYEIVDIRSEQAPGSFTGFGLYYPVLKSERSSDLINEGKGFEPRHSYKNIPTKLLIEQGINPEFENEADKVLDLLKNNPDIKLGKDDVIARYSGDFVIALEALGFENLEFDLNTPMKNESLRVLSREEYLILAEEYDEQAREILLKGIISEQFGDTTDQMRNAANIIAGNKTKLDKRNIRLYSTYTLHALDFDQAVRYMSVNRFFLGEDFDDVRDSLCEYYKRLKVNDPSVDDQGQDDLERFEYFLDMVIAEVVEREDVITEKIRKHKEQK